jgi:NAD-dependent SIR2 family protein deacetylase
LKARDDEIPKMVDRSDLTPSLEIAVHQAAGAVRQAEALLITAGAGMGVDSGLPDFRGPEGFWRAYPPYRKLGLHFQQLANPSTFSRDPKLAWGFYGHRLSLYHSTRSHRGFDILLKWAQSKPGGCFVFTSNVDGHFPAAGFPQDRLFECHGSIHHLPCTHPCRSDVWPADGTQVSIDADMRAIDPLPKCPHCGAIARPNMRERKPRSRDDGSDCPNRPLRHNGFGIDQGCRRHRKRSARNRHP